MEKLTKLLESNSQKKISGIEVPKEFYWVLDSPAPLAGMRYPDEKTPWLNFRKVGFNNLISLEPISYDPNPLKLIYSEQLQDLFGGRIPRNPEDEKQKIIRATIHARSALLTGEGVIIHCCGGTGRTGTVLGCILREFGFPADETINFLDRIQKARGKKCGWPESPWQAALVREWKPVTPRKELLLH